MQIKEINIDNVVEFFNINAIKYKANLELINPITKQFLTVREFDKISVSFIDTFFTDYKKNLINLDIDSPIYGANVFINEAKKDIKQKNIKKLEFESLYPNIIIILYDQGIIKFNVDEFVQLYKFIVYNKEELLNHKKMDDNCKKLLRFMINYFYGSTYTKGVINTFSNVHTVKEYFSDTMKNLFENCSDVIYVEVDVIYYDCDDDIIINYIKHLNLPYKITYNIDGYFFMKAKYVTDCNGFVKFRGFEPKKGKFYGHYQYAVDDLKKGVRIKKLKELRKCTY